MKIEGLTGLDQEKYDELQEKKAVLNHQYRLTFLIVTTNTASKQRDLLIEMKRLNAHQQAILNKYPN
jgi:hypothetical protein